ncbi:glycerophosphodiester phosphodiesterase [Bacillus sp. CECT 9360]|uniref:glycerophosphodiester phosphodiesterase n=1 Tax=Bacillus sp. CECT 9360 TaxID=2845821 RepID=UPI001E44F46D|nr:glycerophosphodiester phosphodiesterase [Bacillus sp. CECT 9360]CAH0345670.1 Glycerophosphodiester phosphodiesterase [Bacillus sp. CECT 9360]
MTLIFAHRGSSGTHPENTMISFQEAKRAGADGLEIDVQLSRDGEIVIIHDEKLDRTTNGTGYVKDNTLEQIKSYNASHQFDKQYGCTEIPTLVELFDWLQGNDLLCNIELKNGVFPYPGMEEKVIGLIRSYRLEDRIILSSFNHYSLVYCVRIAPELETAPLYRDGLYMPWVYAQSIGAKAIHPSIKAAPDYIINSAIRAGTKVRPFTVNNETRMEELIRIGCSAFFTDFPENAIKLRQK